MNVSDCYSLKLIDIDPKQLLLDPNNPRLSSEWDITKAYTASDIKSAKVQGFVFKEIMKGKHRVKKLVQSMATHGFVRGSQPMIVKQLANSSCYVVLEGNRRTAAIRYLLDHAKDLNTSVLASLKSIPVQIFQYCENEIYKESEVVDVLLGTIHVEGPESWGAMEKAHYIYRGYVRELIRKLGKTPFVVDTDVLRQISINFNLSTVATKKVLGIYRVFQQLQKAKYEVTADDYSLIELAITRKVARDNYFSYNEQELKMPDSGLDRFSNLCLEREAPVRNPQDFASFCYVLTNGTKYELNQIVEEKLSPKEIKQRTMRRVEKRVFVEKLVQVKELVEKIKLDDFRGTAEEVQLIRQIEKLVLRRLVPLSSSANENGD